MTTQRLNRETVTEILGRVFQELENNIEILRQYANAPLPTPEVRTAWIKQLTPVIVALVRYRRRLAGKSK